MIHRVPKNPAQEIPMEPVAVEAPVPHVANSGHALGYGLGFRVRGSGFRVQGLGLGV